MWSKESSLLFLIIDKIFVEKRPLDFLSLSHFPYYFITSLPLLLLLSSSRIIKNSELGVMYKFLPK